MVYVLDADSGHPVSQPSVENDDTPIYSNALSCLVCLNKAPRQTIECYARGTA